MICKLANCNVVVGKNASYYCSREHYNADKVYNYKTNKINMHRNHASIELLHGISALIDKDDVDKIKDRGWLYTRSNGVISNKRKDERKPNEHGHYKLHRIIMDAPDGKDVDHINGNTLDNRKSNLRILSHGDNIVNQPSRPMRNIEFSNGSYCVRLRYRKVRHYIGRYKVLEDAVKARDEAALKIHGDLRQR